MCTGQQGEDVLAGKCWVFKGQLRPNRELRAKACSFLIVAPDQDQLPTLDKFREEPLRDSVNV